MTELLLMPKLMPLLLLNTTVPAVAVWVPAALFTAAWTVWAGKEILAVIWLDPDIPNEILFELANTKVPDVPVWVPAAAAAIPAADPGTTLAVMVPPSIPKDTPLELLNTTVPFEASVVPAEIAAGAVD